MRDRTFLPSAPVLKTRGLRATARPRAVKPPALEARYTWRACLAGFALLAIAARFVMFALQAEAGLTADPRPLLAAAVASVLAIAWIAQGLLGGQALRIDENGITGFTVLGTRHFAWDDIDHVLVAWHPVYKQQMTIHAVWGSRTGGWGIVSPTSMPIMTGKIDRPLGHLLGAITAHRPGLQVRRTPTLDRLARALTWFSREWTQPTAGHR